MKAKPMYRNIIFWLVHAVGLMIWLGISYRLLDQPQNYWGFNIMWTQAVFFFNIVFVLLSKPDSHHAIYFNVTSILLINVLFYFNVLVPYEVWLDRSMPTRFQFSSPF